MQGEKKKERYVDLVGREGIVACVSLDQSYRGAMFQFERAYLQHKVRQGPARTLCIRTSGLNVSHFYRRCRQLGVPVRADAPA